MFCSDCSAVEPLEDEGDLRVRPLPLPLAAALHTARYDCQGPEEEGLIRYQSREGLLQLLQLLEQLEQENNLVLAVCITGKSGSRLTGRWVSLDQLNIRINNNHLIDIIIKQDFCSYMQPIVNFAEEIVGFEFLLRPLPHGSRFQPYELFELARQAGFHSFLDRAARISAIETGAKLLPGGIKRFINFLPSSIYNPMYCLTHTFEVISRLKQDPQDFVFEVVETEKIDNIPHLQTIFAQYRRQGMQVALDDVGAGYSTVEVMSTLKPDYVKIDRSLISYCDEDPVKQKVIRDIMNLAGEFGGKLLAEGIERREEYQFCRDLGMDLGQGYLFGKPEKKPPGDFSCTV